MRNERLSCLYKQCIECILKQQLTAIVPKQPSMKLIEISRIEMLMYWWAAFFTVIWSCTCLVDIILFSLTALRCTLSSRHYAIRLLCNELCCDREIRCPPIEGVGLYIGAFPVRSASTRRKWALKYSIFPTIALSDWYLCWGRSDLTYWDSPMEETIIWIL